jgi:RHH-type transcriptional regulator, rel operon repressor / antitoxin RelB
MKDVITIRIDPEVKKKLTKMARATARTRSFLVADAIQEYLNVNEWQLEAIQEGVRQADEGLLVPHEEVRKRWEAKGEDSMD